MRKDTPHILLINPWIDDFAAYDFWAKPLGLLSIAGILRHQGYQVAYIDCLDRFHPEMIDSARTGRFGKGPYAKRRIDKPKKLHDVPRNFSRYGIAEELTRRAVKNTPRPDAVLVTSLMTYWYPGALAVIKIIREVLPKAPVVLGGIYATLCREHAVKHAGADEVISGEGEAGIVEAVDRLSGSSGRLRFTAGDLDTYPYPAFDLQHAIAYVPILTGRGCPFRCAYCASGFLNRRFVRRSPEHVVEEISYWHEKYGVRDFAFYDDALLIDADSHIMPILEGVVTREIGVRFHTPNALHIRALSRDVARMLFHSGFKTIRLGLETAFFEGRNTVHDKVGPDEFEKAACNLKEAGFTGEAVGAYLLFGLPGQDLVELEASIKMVKACGVRPVLAQYSPIPHTALWDAAVAASRYDLASDPIFHNNSIFPCQKEPFSWEKASCFKQLTR
ncbi:MAG: B12-binding domain-containing radical SAM protein [Desulfobacterales bacterium]|nr:B12-binding domain-containing radical SAM protein [Desulfobacterales bacterium]